MNLEQQLRVALAPCEPGPASMDFVMARLSRRRAPRRIIISSLLALAAAAALFSARFDDPAIQQEAVVPAQDTAPGSAVVADALPPPLVSAAPAPVLENSAPPEVIAAVKPFTVSIQLQNQARDAAISAVDSFYAAFLDSLRAVPGLTLIEQKSGATAATTPADYKLMVQGSGPVAGSRFTITVWENPVELPGVGTIGKSGFGSGGDMANPAALVTSMMESVRSKVLPPDPAYKQRLQAQLLDASRDPRQRMNALTGLLSVGRAPAGGGAVPLDPVALKGAIDLAASTTDPEQRAQIWRALRGVGNASLVPPLVESLRDDSSMEVRLTALATLSADFRDDARAHATLESLARDDARPLVRALAQRALTGDAAWKQYIVSSLQDATRPVAERIEAFAYQMYGMTPGSSNNQSTGDPRLLDDAMIQALAPVLPQAADLPNMVMMRFSAPQNLLATGKPAAVAVVLEMVKQTTEPNAKSVIVNQLTQSANAPRIRAALEKIGADDPDPQLRQIAADVLKSSTPTEASISAGLGMVLGTLKQKDIDPGLRASLTRQLTERSVDPAMRLALEKLSVEDQDPQLRQIAADLLKSWKSAGK